MRFPPRRGLQSLPRLLEIAERPALGPAPSFERSHFVLAFITIGESGTIGRQALAVRSGLKEGPTRTVIKRLRDDGYAEANASGCYLTPSGRGIYETLRTKLSSFVPLDGSRLTIGEHQVALLVRAGGRAVQNGLEQRDSAVRLNASGATTFVIKDGKFTIPGEALDSEKDFPGSVWTVLRDALGPRNGDAVVICGAKNEVTAKLGALSAALSLF